MPARCFALVPAAGAGSRFGDAVPKQYLPIGDRPLLAHTVAPFVAHAAIAHVFVVIAADDAHFARTAAAWLPDRVTGLPCGGATRAASVAAGLAAIAGRVRPDDWVLVHDAARPCLAAADLDRLLDAVLPDPVGGLLAVPAADTLKRDDGAGRVARTEPRDGIWQAQTPQMFRHRLLCEALAAPGAATATDEASAVERLGLRPRLVPGASTNLKVTWPADLALAAWILRGRAGWNGDAQGGGT